MKYKMYVDYNATFHELCLVVYKITRETIKDCDCKECNSEEHEIVEQNIVYTKHYSNLEELFRDVKNSVVKECCFEMTEAAFDYHIKTSDHQSDFTHHHELEYIAHNDMLFLLS